MKQKTISISEETFEALFLLKTEKSLKVKKAVSYDEILKDTYGIKDKPKTEKK